MEINWIALLVATIASFAIGFIWYNMKVFGTAWAKSAGMTEEQMNDRSGMGRIFGGAFVFTFIMALMLSYFVRMDTDLSAAARHGAYIGLGISTMAMGVNALYEKKGWLYILINGGYITTTTIVMAVIIAAMS